MLKVKYLFKKQKRLQNEEHLFLSIIFIGQIYIFICF